MELFLVHNEWNDLCILENNIIKRKNISNEKGYYYYDNDLLVVKWDYWNDLNKFKKFENYYIDIKIDYKINNILIYDDLLNKNNNYLLINEYIIQINEFNSKKNRNKYLINKKKYLVIQDNHNEIIDIFYMKNDVYFNIKNLNNIENNENNIKNLNNIENNIENNENNINKNNIENNKNDEKYENNTKNIENKFTKLNKMNYNIDDYTDNKNIFILENNIFYSQEYYNKNINVDKKYCCHFDLNYNKNENFFFNYSIYNSNYLDLNNYQLYKNNYIVNKKDLLNKYFSIDINLELDVHKKKILTLSEWGYPPFGGGENWLLNLSKIFNDLNYDVYLLCFSNGFNCSSFTKTEIINLSYVKIIQMEYNLYKIIKMIKYINPCIINHQGIKRIEFMKIANVLNIPFISGYCFWNNIIKQTYSNIKILENNSIEKDNSFEYVNKCY
jgi:hypothetical protein